MTKAKGNIGREQAPLKFEQMLNYSEMAISDAVGYAQEVDRAIEGLDEASSVAGYCNEDRLEVALMCADDQHQALIDLIATSQAQSLKEALSQMLVAERVLDQMADERSIRARHSRDLRKLLMIFESVILILEDQLGVRRQDFDVYAVEEGRATLRPHMRIAA